MAEIVATIVGFVGASTQIKEYVVTPIKNQFSYLFCYDKLIQSLRVQVERLDNKRSDLQLRVDAASRNLQVIDRGVLEWLERVEKIKQDSDNLVGAVPEDQNGTCLNGKCPKPKLRYCQSRQATKLTAAVVELLEKPDKFQTISYPPPPMGIEAIPAPSGTQEFQSRKEKEEEIMACLKNDTIFMIGVCGMGGVGKTTMATKIWRRASEEKIFDEIVMTEGLGQGADQLKIQQQIAKGLGLQLTKDTRTNCAMLLQRLTKGKKVLLVLDDVWERLDLEELGIPSQSMNKGCKIMLTTRNDRVCIESTDDAKEIINLEVLREEEAWSLFRDKAGSVVDQDDLRELAINVAKECKGLPLALVTVGSALKQRTDIAFWKDAVSELKNAAPINIPGFLKGVYQPLQLSYKALESDEARYLFLICCLFPEDSLIRLEELVQYGIGLGIFSNIGNLGEARDRVCVLVGNLKSCFLLMDATDKYGLAVKMHDVVRDMAIWISSNGTEHVFKVSHEIGLSEWPIKDSCENYTSISLTLGESIVNIPECMNCPRLEALLVDCKRNYSDEAPKLPDTFFNRMSGLRLLSISYCIVDLSSSLSLLTQLRVLRLHDCVGLKKMISFIGEFVNLEILSLWDSYIEVLPHQIGALTKLKVLDLNYCRNLKKIAPGVISRLVQLEELRLLYCPIEWEGGEEKGKERSNASVVEVFSLRNLRALQIWIKDPQVIPHDRGGQLEQELTSYNVTIGEYLPDSSIYQKRMVVDVDEMRKSFVNSMRVLLMGAEYLVLRGKGSKDIIEVLERQGFQNVKELKISSLDTAKHLANALIQRDIAPTRGSAIFPVLRSLDLSYMYDLEEICDGPPTLGSFSKLERIKFYKLRGLTHLWKCSNEKLCLPNLKMIDIWYCEKLKWVFPLSIAESLCQLETIQITQCPNMEEVFFKDEIRQRSSEDEGGDDSDHMNITFPKLNKMILERVPKLSALCKAVDVFEFPKITTMSIDTLSWWNHKMLGSRLPDLVNKEVPYIDSKGLRMSQIDVFTGLHELSISDCSEFRTLFSSDAFKSFINLKELCVRNCLILEEIVEMQKDEEKVLNLPQLKSLKLLELPKIRCFCTLKNTLELPSLKEIIIRDCPLMETFVVESCSTTMPIVEMQKDEEKVLNLPQLKSLYLLELPKIRCFCTFKNTLELPSLKVIIIRDCPLMETFVVESCSTTMPNSSPKFFFSREVTCPNLGKLVLNGIKTASVIFSQEFQISGLKELEVKDCHDFKSMVGKENDDSIPRCFISKEVTFHNLCKLVLHGITTASVIFSHEFPISELQILEVRHCHFKSLVGKEDDDSISRCFITKEVTCSKLKKLVLHGLKFARLIFSHEIPYESLSALEKLEVQSCHNLKSLISLHLFGEMTNLEQLVVRDSSMLEVVLAEEEVDGGSRDKKITNHSKLKKIELSELPKLRSFYSGLESFPLQKWVQIHGIKDPEFASRVFFNREHCQDEDNLSKGCFTLFPSDLSFTCEYSWQSLFLVKGLSDVFFYNCWDKVCGRFGIEKLSPNITYEIIFVIMLRKKSFYRTNLTIVVAEDEREEDMSDKPMEEWIEIVAGEYSASSTQSGEIEFSIISCLGEGIILKCVHIRPKEPIE